MPSNSFVEIEHKFVVDTLFDQFKFFKSLEALSPIRKVEVEVRDVYYVVHNNSSHVYRHRYDNEIQQLTVKSLESDSAVRTEINIPIDQSKGDQRAQIFEFMKTLGCRWWGEISKSVSAYYFHDCEVVFYRASNRNETISCIEFEAINPPSIDAGLKILSHYETNLGIQPENREKSSLFELLLLKTAPQDIQKLFA